MAFGSQQLALKSSDGSAWTWGQNANGQLGDNTVTLRSSPVSVVGAHSFGAISVGTTHNFALKSSDGSAWAWGQNANGRLGDNTVTLRSSPVSVVGAHSFGAISGVSAGGQALKSSDGSVWTWGTGTSGELGDNTATSKSSPVSVVGAHSFSAMGEGINFSLALKSSNGSVWAWGLGTNGGLGDNTATNKSSPVSVVGAHSFNAISGGNTQSLAIKSSDGSVWAWGLGTNGVLGDNTATSKSSPVSVVGAHSFGAIVAGGTASLALKSSDGSAWTWGLGTSGQLGDGQFAVSRSSPVSVVGAHSFVKIANANLNLYALKTDGTVWAWGTRANGTIGDNTDTFVASPVAVVGSHVFAAVNGGGGTYAIALKTSDGSVWGWGINTNGTIGDNSITTRSSPVSVVGAHSFSAIAGPRISTASGNSFGLKSSDGSVWGWGLGTTGQLGEGSAIVSRSSPVSVVGAHSFNAVATGGDHVRALKSSDGSTWTWGTGTSGQLGDNSITSKSSPVSVVGAHSFSAISAWNGGSVGLKSSNGSAWGMGFGTSGQNGDGTTNNRSSPVSVVGAHSFNVISSGGTHSHALKSADGSAWGWGGAANGALGNESLSNRNSPVSVVGGHSFNKIAAGSFFSIALKSNDGSAWAWGQASGQLGDNTSNNRSSPVSVVGAHSFISIGIAGSLNSYGLKSDGSIWSWGIRTSGPLGDNTDQFVASPVQVVQPTSAIKKMLNVTFNRSAFIDITSGTGTIKVVKTINGNTPPNVKSVNGNQ